MFYRDMWDYVRGFLDLGEICGVTCEVFWIERRLTSEKDRQIGEVFVGIGWF